MENSISSSIKVAQAISVAKKKPRNASILAL